MLAKSANPSMRTGKLPPHHELSFLCPPSSQSQRLNPDAITIAVKNLGRCTTGHVLEHLGLPITKGNEMVIAKQLRNLGYVKARVMVCGTQHWVFFPPLDAADAEPIR